MRAGLSGRILVDTGSMMKRLFDVLTSSMALLFLSPILLVIALAIKLESSGPVFFRQTRVGKNGRPFTMYKFRKFPTTYDGQGPGVTVGVEQRVFTRGADGGAVLLHLERDPVRQVKRQQRLGRVQLL